MTLDFPTKVQIKEVGPRDGLQNERQFISTNKKVEWINMLSNSGMDYIEITSFVHPKWIPALSDAVDVAKQIERKEGVTYAALVPNETGLERALESEVDEVSIFISASETHNRKNINKSIDETLPIYDSIIKQANVAGKKVRGYVSTVFGCPYEGTVSVERVKKVVDKLLTLGVYEVSLGDTIGIANPKQMESVLNQLNFPTSTLALHLHDTRGMALANILVGLSKGITVFDSSNGGLGGCPYAKGASGNVATEDLLFMLQQMGIETNINFDEYIQASKYLQSLFSKQLRSHQLQIHS
ncbi:hydroxymethylglutaryl-CoA lyase [Evansella sp. AB-rgal1]|uniref:hydroxymethylglutaryl-CoA lyase n=1 Tax=Evansella sp. AB-rgal1 TaxID=3242696 RepID=UPI00359E57EE